MLYFDRIIPDLKLTKQKYLYILYRPTTAPFLSSAQDFDVTIFAKAKAIYTTDPNTKSQSSVHDCCPNPNPNPNPKPKAKHSVFARRFQRVRSEKNIIEGALMTKRPEIRCL